jgi:hypothetical protein
VSGASDATSGQANTGGGGGGGARSNGGAVADPGAGGSGIVVVKEAATPFIAAPGIWTLADVAKFEAADEWPT